MIDVAARNKIFERNNQKGIFTGAFKAMEEAVELKKENQLIMGKIEERDKMMLNQFDKIGRAIVMIFKKIPIATRLPNVFKIKGEVEVSKMPNVSINNLKDLQIYFQSLEISINKAIKELKVSKVEPTKPIELEIKNFSDLKQYFKSLEEKLIAFAQAASTTQMPQIQIPKIEIPKTDNTALIEAIHGLKLEVPKGNSKDIIDGLYKVEQAIGELINKPTFIPPTVTSVNINSLKGVGLTTAVSVNNTATALPTTPLANRRSLIVFNNGAQTLYIGGSGVTTVNGLPILTQTYSPSIDAGILMNIYGIVASATADVRVLEVSNEASGN